MWQSKGIHQSSAEHQNVTGKIIIAGNPAGVFWDEPRQHASFVCVTECTRLFKALAAFPASVCGYGEFARGSKCEVSKKQTREKFSSLNQGI